MSKLTPEQIRAARAMLRLTAQEVADRAGIGVATVRRAEGANTETTLSKVVDQALRAALEAAGVEFTNGDQPGVRLGKASQ